MSLRATDMVDMVVDGCAFRLFYDKYVEASVERTLRAATPNDIYKGKRCTFYYFS